MKGLNRDFTAEILRIRGCSPSNGEYMPDSDTSALLTRPESRSNPLSQFLILASDTKGELQSLEREYAQLVRKQRDCLRPTFEDPDIHIREVENLTTSISNRLRLIRQRIDFLHSPGDSSNDRDRILANLRGGLLDRYQSFSARFAASQQTFSNAFHQIAPKPTPMELPAFTMDQPGLEEVHEQSEDIAEVEELARSAREIKDLFSQLSTLIAEQGTIIDRIDYNVNIAYDNAESARGHIVKAAEYQKKGRMWICSAILAVIIILLVVFKLVF